MNLYIVVEGKIESKLYPGWLKHLLPDWHRVDNAEEVTAKNYYLVNAGGYPGIIEETLPNAIEEINLIGKYDYLVLCFDADEDTVAEREKAIAPLNETLKLPTKLIPIVQNRCLETWLLGNRKFYKRNPELEQARRFTHFYDVSQNDPELMGKGNDFYTISQFHKEYFKALCQERGIKYSERSIDVVTEQSYLAQLQLRVRETDHLMTFRRFNDFCLTLK